MSLFVQHVRHHPKRRTCQSTAKLTADPGSVSNNWTETEKHIKWFSPEQPAGSTICTSVDTPFPSVLLLMPYREPRLPQVARNISQGMVDAVSTPLHPKRRGTKCLHNMFNAPPHTAHMLDPPPPPQTLSLYTYPGEISSIKPRRMLLTGELIRVGVATHRLCNTDNEQAPDAEYDTSLRQKMNCLHP